MAMNKKEKAYVESLEKQLSFRLTEKVYPDVPIPGYGELEINEVISGFLFNSYNQRVEESCSSSMSHARGRSDKTTTQNPVEQYSSKLLALKAMRFEIERDCIKELYEVDQLIKKEQEK